MDVMEFAKEIHQNAVAHGWWDTEPTFDEILALIHSEWSEALEEYRAGRPMVWYACNEIPFADHHICEPKDLDDCLNFGNPECKYRSKKPEGIAVELADGVIRIMDYLSYINIGQFNFDTDSDYSEIIENRQDGISLPSLVSILHRKTSKAIDDPYWLVVAIRYVFAWIKSKGLDPGAIIHEKHAYNTTRPYRHGGKVC